MQRKSNLKVGFTYDLKTDYLALGYTQEQASEFDSEETIEAIRSELARAEFQVDLIGNLRGLVERLARGHKWDLVFNICEGERGSAREAQVPGLLEAYGIPCVFSNASVLSLTLDKALTQSVLRDHGINSRASWVVRDLKDIEKIPGEFPLFIKPSAEGSSKGIGPDCKVLSFSELRQTAIRLLGQQSGPLLVETYLPGREFTVGILGTGKNAKVLGVLEILFKNETAYCFHTKQAYLERVRYELSQGELAEKVSEVAMKAWQALGCQDLGRVDIRLDKGGVPHFLEVNPLAGLHPNSSDLVILSRKVGVSYADLIGNVMDQAITRLGILCSA